jgi:hypothetical protein
LGRSTACPALEKASAIRPSAALISGIASEMCGSSGMQTAIFVAGLVSALDRRKAGAIAS